MKNIVFIIGFLFVSCSKNAQVYTPVGGMSNEEMGVSKNRAKQLNTSKNGFLNRKRNSILPSSTTGAI